MPKEAYYDTQKLAYVYPRHSVGLKKRYHPGEFLPQIYIYIWTIMATSPQYYLKYRLPFPVLVL